MIAARDPHGQLVAIKRAFDASLDLGAGHRLADDCAGEAAALRALKHPGIVRLLQTLPHVRPACPLLYACKQDTLTQAAVQAGGELLVLELCSGDLERMLAGCRRPLPVEAARCIFVQLLQAVAACHRAGATLT